VKRLGVIALLAVGCKGTPKANMTPQQVIDAITDFADRGCACGQDKECFRAIRTEWEQSRAPILYNAALLKGDDEKSYLEQRSRFGLCGDAAGLAVFDNV
jgi:hypothetical protein